MLALDGFNLHIDVSSSKNAAACLDELDANNLIQHVKQATHIHGHILDLVITRFTEFQVNTFQFNHCIESDHSMVNFHIVIPK